VAIAPWLIYTLAGEPPSFFLSQSGMCSSASDSAACACPCRCTQLSSSGQFLVPPNLVHRANISKASWNPSRSYARIRCERRAHWRAWSGARRRSIRSAPVRCASLADCASWAARVRPLKPPPRSPTLALAHAALLLVSNTHTSPSHTSPRPAHALSAAEPWPGGASAAWSNWSQYASSSAGIVATGGS
jgi:hypothetical protein